MGTEMRLPVSEWRAWADKMIAEERERLFQQRLSQARGKKAVYLPPQMEFGHLIMHYVRLVHFSEADYKIVCCPTGMETLFPRANEFYYNWTSNIPDAERQGTDRWFRDWPEIKANFPDYHLVQAGGLAFAEEKRCIHPEIRLPLKPTLNPEIKPVDVCIGTRSRGLNPKQNWPHCQLIADACLKRGLSFATIAGKNVGYHLDGESYYSGDFPTIDAAIQLLQSAKLYFSQDSGCAHLATTIGINSAILQVPHKIWAIELLKAQGFDESHLGEYGRDFIDRMQEVNAPFFTGRIDPELWFKPEEVVKILEPYLDVITPQKAVAAPAKPTKKKTSKKGAK